MQDPKDQIRHESKMLVNRWDAECDLDEYAIAKAVMEGLNEWLEEDIFEFDSEIEFEEEEDE